MQEMDEKSELAPSVLQALFDNGVCLCVFLFYYFVLYHLVLFLLSFSVYVVYLSVLLWYL